MSCNDDDLIPIVNNTNTNADPEPYGTPFQNTPEIEDIIMYEVNLRAFSPANFQGVESRLDSIKALGVYVIWLMPITPIGEERSVGQLGSPYSVKNYKEVNPEFGDMDDLRSLVDAAHDRGIAVVTDWVANHTAWDNPWMSKTSWYTKDANGNIIHPAGTNWLDVADLNYDNTAMRAEMIRAMKFWILSANIDGFRCDYADGVPYDFWQSAIDTLRNMDGRNLIMLAEGGRSDHYSAGFDMTYGWDFYGKMKSIFSNNENARNIFSTNSAEYSNIPAGKHKLRFTTNHDETAWDMPPTQVFGTPKGSVAAFVATAFLRGVPLIYTGQEVGVDVNMPFFSRYPVNWTMNPSMFQEYKTLMSIYANSEVARIGTTTTYVDNDIISFRKSKDGNDILVLVNTRDNAVTYSLPSAIQNTTWTNAMNNASVTLGTDVTLGNYDYLILEN